MRNLRLLLVSAALVTGACADSLMDARTDATDCEVHGEELFEETVDVVFGLIDFREGYLAARGAR